MDRLLCVQEVADLLGVSRATIYRLIQRNGLPFVRFGKELLRFRPADIEAWVESWAGAAR